MRSDYSFEEGEELSENGQEDATKEPEQLENAENQKISTEKMASSALHRLHVDFDDLSVVDEEEEPKRDKKEISSEDNSQFKEEKSSLSILKSRQLHENVPFYPGAYQSPTCLSSPAYYTECPFKFPSTLNLMMSTEPASMLTTTPCPPINADPIIPIDPLLPSVSLGGPSVDQINDQILHAPPAGWQSNVMIPETQVATFGTTDANLTSVQAFAGIRQDQAKPVEQMIGDFALPTSFHRRKIDGSMITNNTINPSVAGSTLKNTENIVENGWSTGENLKDSLDRSERTKEESPVSGNEKPKHFFAPLPSKIKKQSEESSPTISYLGTGNSSSSDKTGSTIILKNQLTKGSADVYVNGAVPYEDNFPNNKGEQRTFLSTDNLLIENAKSSNGNQLTKSMSWQDLSTKSQPVSANQAEGKQQMLTRSDNTLDNISDSKPYKSYLNVTLKPPRAERVPAALEQAASPDTPEIPNLPTIDYRLFKNPFLRSFEAAAGYMNQNNITRPLSVQVNDDNLCYYPTPHPETSTFKRGMIPFGDKYRQADQNRLLIPTNQLINGKLMSPANKHQIQVTSFERPSPHTLVGPSTPYEFNAGRRLNPNPYLHGQNIYQNVSYFSRGCSTVYPQRGMMYYDNLALKVAAQTQTSIDGDSHHEDEHALSHEESAPSTPSGQRRKRTVRKEKGNVGKEQKSLSPAAQRRLKKQGSVTSSEVPESPGKVTTARKRTRRLSVTTTTTSEGQEDKNESRSSSSGQDSPKKEQLRRVSLYFNAKKRPSLTSMRTVRSGSLDMGREKEALNSERERTNSVSSREIGNEAKTRKASTSSGNVPWCACWGNGCV